MTMWLLRKYKLQGSNAACQEDRQPRGFAGRALTQATLDPKTHPQRFCSSGQDYHRLLRAHRGASWPESTLNTRLSVVCRNLLKFHWIPGTRDETKDFSCLTGPTERQ